MTYLEAAYHILHEAGIALHADEITQRALAQGLITPTGRTPAATMGSRLYTDTKAPDSKFARAGRGLFALAETRPGDINDQVAAINRATRDRLRDLLHNMPPDRFEALITELLLQMGFDERTVTVTPYANDGGIDVVGVYSAVGLTEVNAAVQVKRWRANVRAPTVTQLRGSLQVHQQGIIITTSDFSTGARQEAAAIGKTRIGLINGEELLDLLVQHRVGVLEKTLTVTALDDEWWGELISPITVVEPPPPVLPLPPIRPDSPTGRKPQAFTLLGERVTLTKWSALLPALCNRLIEHIGPDFLDRVSSMRGTKRPYFTSDATLLRQPGWISGTELWVETHFSAEDILLLAHRILAVCDMPASALVVEYAP